MLEQFPKCAGGQLGAGAGRGVRDLCTHGLEDDSSARLLRCGAREIVARPNNPAANLLKLRQGLIRAADRGFRHALGVAQDQNRAWLGVSPDRNPDHDAIPHLRLAAEHRLEILGVNLHAFRRDDHVFCPAFEIEVALSVQFAAVAGRKPTARVEHGPELAALPVTGGHAPASPQTSTN